MSNSRVPAIIGASSLKRPDRRQRELGLSTNSLKDVKILETRPATKKFAHAQTIARTNSYPFETDGLDQPVFEWRPGYF